MDKEKSIINCKACGLTKERILAGKYPDGRCNKWIDINGREWNGHTCADCHAAKQKQKKQLERKNSYIK